MDARRFDALTRLLGAPRTRRSLGALVAMLGLGSLAAEESRAKKKDKIKKNAFGCVNVKGNCRGKDNKCCSGICKGKKPKKDEKDKSKCKAHDQSTCQPGQTIGDCGGIAVECVTSFGFLGQCVTTTGNAGYCFLDGDCFPCKKDSDCIPFCGDQAACIACPGGECAAAGGTACVGPGFCTI
jgi:hypothetical protein